MKKTLLPLMLFASLLNGSAWAQDSFPAPKLVNNPSDDIFAPPGFDENDNTQIVAYSQLINTCYKAAPPDVEIDKGTKQIRVSTRAYVYAGCWCLQVILPVVQTIDLGPLPAGDYQVVELDGTGRPLRHLPMRIAESRTPAPDEFLYAPVKQARLDLGAAGSAKTLILSGTFSSSCMEMQEIKVLHRAPNIVEVLPIAAYKTGSTCDPVQTPFEVKVALPAPDAGNNLIYVRSLNGQAISIVEPF
jgi:hypothetical protein